MKIAVAGGRQMWYRKEMKVAGPISSFFQKHARPWSKGVSALLWPRQCRLCGSFPEEGSFLCGACWEELSLVTAGDYCRRCGRSVGPFGRLGGGCGYCEQERILTDGILRAGRYDSVLRQMLLRLKFQEMTEFAPFLGPLLKSVFETRPWGPIDYLVPVPLHWLRRLQRGFNQSFLLAKEMADSDVPVCRDLVRIRYTRRQWTLTNAQRRRNVKGAFAVRRRHPFEGRTVCLVDDITTSRATLNECARVLKRAGAEKVYAVVAAASDTLG